MFKSRYIVEYGASLFDPESVKAAIARMDVSESTKYLRCVRYEAFLKHMDGTWERPKYRRESRIPFVPLETELDQLIADCTPTVAWALQIGKEIGTVKERLDDWNGLTLTLKGISSE